MRYTVTKTTKSCPYCRKIIEESTSGQFAPLLGVFTLICFYIVIPVLLIIFLGFKSPFHRPIGEKTMKCPHCSGNIATGNVSLDELDAEELLNYKFKGWVIFACFLGAIWGTLILFIATSVIPIMSIWSIIAVLAFAGTIALIVIYRCKLSQCKK